MDNDRRDGRVIDGRYRLIAEVGRGAMGEVYRAEQLLTGRRVAIKILRSERAGDPMFETRLRREAEATSRIEHRNVVGIEDFGRDSEGSLYMAMEWLNGETLEDRLERGPMRLEQTVDVASQICAGLQAAHDIGLVHRDLKPANVFLVGSDPPRVVLVDFGIAKLIGDQARSALTEQGTFVGTPYYVAPEQALGEPLDRRSDLYALGAMLYELISGHPPFEASSVMGVLQQHIEGTPPPPSRRASTEVSPALDGAVLRCLAKRPEERFDTAAELADEIHRAYRGREVDTPSKVSSEHAVPPPSSSHSMIRAIRPGPGRRIFALVAILVVMAALGVGAWGLLGSKHDADNHLPTHTSYQHSGRTPLFQYAATVTPSPSRPGHELTIAFRIIPASPAIDSALKAGRLSAAIEIRDSRKATLMVTQRGIAPTGVVERPVSTVPHASGTYAVEFRLMQGAERVGAARFDMCVGADPLGDPGLLQRMCPGFSAAPRTP